jgi:hypothetical protein
MIKENPAGAVIDGIEMTRRYATEATNVARQTAERGLTFNRQLVTLWAAGAEANLKAAFELQNAAMAAGQSLFAATGTNPAFYEQWTTMVRQAQQATLEAWQASKRLGEQFDITKSV